MTDLSTADRRTISVRQLANCMQASLEAMVRTEMDPSRWPADWSEDDRREMAERAVFGFAQLIQQED